jgi:hypothetical protein
MRHALIAVLSAALLGGCGGRDTPPRMAQDDTPADWRAIATPADRGRLRTWRTSWLDALGRARANGAAREIAAQGVLLDPDRFLTRPIPPAGAYRCRVFKLGARGAGMRDYVAYPAYDCRVDQEGDIASFHKITGSQRPVGLIFPDPQGRAVFLGTLMLGDETRAMEYGRDTTRDMIGYVDRVAERQWRIVVPQPAFESTLDVIELVPAG